MNLIAAIPNYTTQFLFNNFDRDNDILIFILPSRLVTIFITICIYFRCDRLCIVPYNTSQQMAFKSFKRELTALVEAKLMFAM